MGGSRGHGGLGFWPRTTVILVKPLLIVLTKRDWSGMDRYPAERRRHLRGQPHVRVRPVRRRRTTSTTPVAGRSSWPSPACSRSRCWARCCGRCKQIPVRSRHGRREQGTRRRGRRDQARRGRDHLPGGHDAEEGRPVAAAGQDRHRAAVPGHRCAGRADRDLGCAADLRPAYAQAAAAAAHPGDGRRRRRRSTCPSGTGAEPTAANLYAITDEIMLVLRTMVGEIRGETPPPAPSSAAGRRAASDDAAGHRSGRRRRRGSMRAGRAAQRRPVTR